VSYSSQSCLPGSSSAPRFVTGSKGETSVEKGKKRGRPVSTRTCGYIEDDGTRCGAKHRCKGYCNKHYKLMVRPRCWCGRQRFSSSKLCYGHFLRAEGLIPKDVDIGKASGRRRKHEAVTV